MGIKSLVQNGYDTVRLASVMKTQVSKIVRLMGEDRVYRALTNDEEMNLFAREVYGKLSFDVKQKISVDVFIKMVVDNKERLLSKKSNKKKILNHKKWFFIHFSINLFKHGNLLLITKEI